MAIRIIGWGEAESFPYQNISNDDVLEWLQSNGVDTKEKTGEDTQKLLGIVNRKYSRHHGSTDLGLLAAQAACERAVETQSIFSPEKLKLIHFTSSSPDNVFPAGACRIQHRLDIPAGQAEARDISLGCTGWVDSLILAQSRMKDAQLTYGLVVAGETIGSRMNNYKSLDAAIWGDGGGAVVLELGPNRGQSGFITGRTFSDGQFADWTSSQGLGTDPWHKNCSLNASMENHGREIHGYCIRHVPEAIKSTFARQPYDLQALLANPRTFLLPHNANLRMVRAIGERLGISAARVLSKIPERGNTSSASIPITLAYYANSGFFRANDLLIFAAFGAGMSISVAVYCW
jgi:3-oxoacyl-[acyl-carrier-protein] synthase III